MDNFHRFLCSEKVENIKVNSSTNCYLAVGFRYEPIFILRSFVVKRLLLG